MLIILERLPPSYIMPRTWEHLYNCTLPHQARVNYSTGCYYMRILSKLLPDPLANATCVDCDLISDCVIGSVILATSDQGEAQGAVIAISAPSPPCSLSNIPTLASAEITPRSVQIRGGRKYTILFPVMWSPFIRRSCHQ